MTGKNEHFYSIIWRRQKSQRNDQNSGNWVTEYFANDGEYTSQKINKNTLFGKGVVEVSYKKW